ncbi:MAG: DEAD/DEAH box helicase [Wenzhouxiangellaceae bacterium]|nr:MAG: DEAD/DEAH box helicase [Wenzhouxiangellaceae bacterium]
MSLAAARVADLLNSLDADRAARGRVLFASGAVAGLQRGRLDDLLILTGLVNDGAAEAFRVHASIDGGRLSGDCTCSRGVDCEHVAALCLAATEQTPEQLRERASRRLQLAGGRASTAAAQRMIYLLRLSPDGEELSVCPSRLATAAGAEAVTTPYALSRLQDARQPDYVGEDDLAILHDLADRVVEATDLVWIPLGPNSQKLIRAMLATGRCHWNTADGACLSLAEPLPATAEWELLASGYQRLLLVADDESEALQLPLLPPWRVNPDSGRCRPLQTLLDEPRVAELLAAGPVAPDEVRDVITKLEDAPSAFPRPRLLKVEHLDAHSPLPCLELVNVEVGSGSRFETVPAARLVFAYGPVRLEWEDECSSRLDQEQRVLSVSRDTALEEAATVVLEQAGLAPLAADADRDYRPGDGSLWVARRSDRADMVWLSFQQGFSHLRQQGWLIERCPDFSLTLVEPESWYGDLAESVRSADEIELDLGVVWNGQRHSMLPALLAWIEHTPLPMLRQLINGELPNGQVTLSLDERRRVLVPMERLAATLRGLVDCLDQIPRLRQGKLRLPRGRLAELAATGTHWQLGGDAELAELSRRLGDFSGIEPSPAPAGMTADLRAYQRYGLGWLQFLRRFGFGGILADDMGLGKTIQTLAHILAEKRAGRLDQPCLVVAPTSLMFNWRAEARKFAPDLKVLTLHGPERKGRFQWMVESDLVLTTYALLARDIEHFRRQRFHLLILDEAQAIKNPRAKVSRMVRELDSRHRLCLSGTPLENHLGELWSLFDFLMPGLLGSQARFRRLFRNPIERHGEEDRRELLARRIRPFFLRRTKAEVAPELPPKTEIMHAVPLSGAQRQLYERTRVALHDKVRQALASQGVERSRIVVLDALLRLRQICCDPRLLKGVDGAEAAESAKLELLMELLPEMVAEGRRVLLFSQFVGMLELIEKAVRRQRIDYVKLTGATRDRQSVVERFQSGQVPLFLISLKAGGVGLNLTAADTVIHYDPWWNPAVEDQATDRAHRIGQAQKVFVYRLLAEDTIEQKVHELQQSKRGLVEGLLGGGGAAQISAEDLDSLFEPLG